MPTYLDGIVAAHRARAARDRRGRVELEALLEEAPAPRAFLEALRGGPIGVIAEVKRRSPSRGALALDLDPDALVRAYARGGAACVSVLTDEAFFGGSAEDLRAARAAVELPVLRKDFTVCAADLYEARAMGADAALLIVAALSDDELAQLHALAQDLGLTALVEVHDADELARALAAGARCVGVNQRDLHTFSVDHERAVSLRGAIPDEIVAVAESGIKTHADLEGLAAAGFDACLIGESLVTAADPEQALRALSGAATGAAEASVAPCS